MACPRGKEGDGIGMEDDTPRPSMPLGLWELDGAGTVLHHEPAGGGGETFRPAEVVGRNFFGDVLSTGQSEELREHVESFISGHATAHSLDLGPGPEGGVRTRVLLARIHGRAAQSDTETILVHVRKV